MSRVIDSGALVELLVRHGQEATVTHPEIAGHELHAPHLIDPEFLNATRKMLTRSAISLTEADELRMSYARIDITRYAHDALANHAWSLRDNLSPYDAMYVALAATLQVGLITADRRLAREAEPHCEVHLLR